ncbi:MAG: uracil-DNA glycosylase, partial [Planctomycetota bacterium]
MDAWSIEHWISVTGPELLVPAPRRCQEPEAAGAAEEPGLEQGGLARHEALSRLAAEARLCKACPLHRERRQAVFADGSPDAEILFLGEAPGQDEDRQGLPFVGRAGRLLTDMIQKAMGIPRSAVYIANVVKCRPPGNRNPAPPEQAACGHFLEEQIRLVQPRILICLGSVAAHFLIETNLSVGRMRGRLWDYEGRPVVVTWHPA